MALPGFPFLDCGLESLTGQLGGAMPGGTHFVSCVFEMISFGFLMSSVLKKAFIQYILFSFLKFLFIHLGQK